MTKYAFCEFSLRSSTIYLGRRKLCVMSCIIKNKFKSNFFGRKQYLFVTLLSRSCSIGTISKDKVLSSPSFHEKYDPKDVESGLYEWWEKQNYFKPAKSENDSFIVLLPPPNITGSLHLGHVLTATIQDVILRWKRMKGESVMWIPGIDHAGIATQVTVEKYLSKTLNLSRHSLGKEKFIKKVWEWKKNKEKQIHEQLKNIGASLDWSIEKFTMDPVHTKIVTDSFIKLFHKGLIYQSEGLVNWSCSLQSSISDMEVDWLNVDKRTRIHVPGYQKPIEFGIMYKIAYKICDEDDEIVVDTTRPETMLGDVAIAVHPNDPVNAKFINKMALHPFRCEKIPIVADDMVHINLGTGAVKITPAHSFDDYQVGNKHNLKCINVINDEGCINRIGQIDKFFGLKRYDARHVLIDELKNLGLFRGTYEQSMKLPICSRTGDVIEFMIKKQWFLSCKSLADKAIELVKKNQLTIEPENYKNVWYEWLSNIKDWNLSRQLWWGHRIPLYECTVKENKIWLAAENLEQAKLKAREKFKTSEDDVKIVQDPDVLDTWFSSGLLPLNVLSNALESLSRPPISLMVTGHDILFFWVARMVMLTTCLTGKLPFNRVILHGLMCDSNKKKMSKSLGNVIQPEDIIYGRSQSEMKEELKKKTGSNENLKSDIQLKMFPQGIPACGADALRFTLCSKNVHSSFINFDMENCISNRHFCNKIWQAMRYFVRLTDNFKELDDNIRRFDFENAKLEEQNLNLFDKWILSSLAKSVNVVNESLESNMLHSATAAIKFFTVEHFCSIYLEISKSIFKNNLSHCGTTILVFHHCMETILKLLSPFMPFVTERLYQALPMLKCSEKFESVTIARFPNSNHWMRFRDVELEKNFDSVLKLITALRSVNNTYQLSGKNPKVFLICPDEISNIVFGDDRSRFIVDLGRVGKIEKANTALDTDIIEKVISNDLIAYIEHGYDKITVKKIFESTMNKEENLKKSLEKLNVQFSENTSKKLQYEYTKIETQLQKIEEIKKVIERCSR